MHCYASPTRPSNVLPRSAVNPRAAKSCRSFKAAMEKSEEAVEPLKPTDADVPELPILSTREL